MRVSVEESAGALEIFVSGAIKDSFEHGCVGFYVHNEDSRYHVLLSKNGRIHINEHPKELSEAVGRFNEIVNAYFENGQ